MNSIAKVLASRDLTLLSQYFNKLPGQPHPNDVNEHGQNIVLQTIMARWRDGLVWVLSQGADPNSKDRCGINALMYTIRRGDVDMLLTLCDSGADINQTCGNNLTPLMYAAELKSPEIFFWLLDHGADLYARDLGGRTAVHCLSEEIRSEVVRRLKELGHSNLIDSIEK